ncbi:hypothetical protein TNCV_4507131 [Trichonephila clavipes]|nr:hypothetical protein TNCV_4507131 [Trichonephila clavipes]
MNVCSMQLPSNGFHGYRVLLVGIYLERYLRQCSLAFSGNYPLQHPYIKVLQLRLLPIVVLLRRHLIQIYVVCVKTLDTMVLKTSTRSDVLDMEAPAKRGPTIIPLLTSERSDIITLC